jgi:hypothetical protein
MKARTLAAIGAAALIGATGAVMLPVAASARTVNHTLKFVSVRQQEVSVAKTETAQSDKDVNAKGKVIGFDMLYIVSSEQTDAVNANVTLDVKGGFLYGTLQLSPSGPVIHGKVTGGTGAFKGAAGTISAKVLNASGSRTAVSVTYHT